MTISSTDAFERSVVRRNAVRSALRVTQSGVALFAAVLIGTAPLSAQQRQTGLLRGADILQEQCSRCHAVGLAEPSPLSKAPPFRDLHKRYDVSALAEALAEGIVTGHEDMPAFSFPPADIDAIITYLKSLEPGR